MERWNSLHYIQVHKLIKRTQITFRKLHAQEDMYNVPHMRSCIWYTNNEHIDVCMLGSFLCSAPLSTSRHTRL